MALNFKIAFTVLHTSSPLVPYWNKIHILLCKSVWSFIFKIGKYFKVFILRMEDCKIFEAYETSRHYSAIRFQYFYMFLMSTLRVPQIPCFSSQYLNRFMFYLLATLIRMILYVFATFLIADFGLKNHIAWLGSLWLLSDTHFWQH